MFFPFSGRAYGTFSITPRDMQLGWIQTSNSRSNRIANGGTRTRIDPGLCWPRRSTIELYSQIGDVGKIRTCKGLTTCCLSPVVATTCVTQYATRSKSVRRFRRSSGLLTRARVWCGRGEYEHRLNRVKIICHNYSSVIPGSLGNGQRLPVEVTNDLLSTLATGLLQNLDVHERGVLSVPPRPEE